MLTVAACAGLPPSLLDLGLGCVQTRILSGPLHRTSETSISRRMTAFDDEFGAFSIFRFWTQWSIDSSDIHYHAACVGALLVGQIVTTLCVEFIQVQKSILTLTFAYSLYGLGTLQVNQRNTSKACAHVCSFPDVYLL